VFIGEVNHEKHISHKENSESLRKMYTCGHRVCVCGGGGGGCRLCNISILCADLESAILTYHTIKGSENLDFNLFT